MTWRVALGETASVRKCAGQVHILPETPARIEKAFAAVNAFTVSVPRQHWPCRAGACCRYGAACCAEAPRRRVSPCGEQNPKPTERLDPPPPGYGAAGIARRLQPRRLPRAEGKPVPPLGAKADLRSLRSVRSTLARRAFLRDDAGACLQRWSKPGLT